jgi:hypothetical protein
VRLRRHGPFAELSSRQLDLFAADEVELLHEAAAAEDAWTRASREEAEEAYGDYQLVVDALADRLLDMRETFAATLAGETADAYRAAFSRAARQRFPRYASLLADLDDV